MAYFAPCSSVSIVNFEQVNAGWFYLVFNSVYLPLRYFTSTFNLLGHIFEPEKIVFTLLQHFFPFS